MRKFHENAFKGLTYSVSALALVMSASAFAQDTDADAADADEDPVDVTDTGAQGTQGNDGAIVVTGSRIKRNTYSSISPLQVLTTEQSQEAGLFDPSQILQRSESASGQQIDATFQGFVLDNGPGSQTVNLRGLGADRTLLLVNGRRLAPAGVEGAPSNPSINLLPGSLIERYDLLLDGASSVYGSDAVAGVGNIVLRKDFDGLELFARGEINPQGAGEDYTISGAYGINLDRGFIGIGAEYDYRDTVRIRDRDFFQGCATHREFTQNGDILTTDLRSNAVIMARNPAIGVSEQDCVITSQVGRTQLAGTYFGFVWFQPDVANTGIPNYSATADAFGRDIDSDGDGQRDVDFANGFNRNGADPSEVFLSEQKLFNVMAYGEYTFDGDLNLTPFFEANFSRAEVNSDNSGAAQLFPWVPGDNLTNPCNITTGLDCRAANNAFEGFGPGNPNALGTGTSVATRPVVSIQGDRDNVRSVQEQYRGVFGLKGDLPFISPSWTFETSFVYSRSEGSASRRGIREDKLAFALGIDPTADFGTDGVFDNNGDGIADDYVSTPASPLTGGACNAAGLRNPNAALPDLTAGCVPLNLFAASVLGSPIGSLSTQAEEDYLFGLRTFDTTYEQLIGSAYITGNVIDLPAGPVGAVFGVEMRKDKIDSQPDAIASNGLLWGFFADEGAQGSKVIKEAFGELDIPLQAGKPWVEELNLKLAGRVTDEEFYGTNFTYSIAAGWRPIQSLQLKFTYGTSFRAPNLRENFLAGQTGFQTLLDPCAVPTEAFDGLNGGYNAANDTRDSDVLDSCRREMRDPTTVGIDPGSPTLPPVQLSSSEITSGGSLDIDPETSRSMTAGFAFEETFGDGYDISLGASYFDIKLEGSIVEPSPQFILNDCFALREPSSVSPFCERITYDPQGRALVTDVAAGFLNLNSESVRGIDFNASFGKEVAAFGKLIDLGLDVRANHLIERSSLFINNNGEATYDDDAGEFSLPKWTGRATFTADIDNFRFTWQTRYTGPVKIDRDIIDDFSDVFRNPIPGVTATPNAVSDTCLGAGSANGNVAGDGVFCRDVDFANEQFLHTASIRYRMSGRFTIIAGVDNIFDTAPPLVDPSEVLSIANTAIGNGYDYDGREFFLSINFEF